MRDSHNHLVQIWRLEKVGFTIQLIYGSRAKRTIGKSGRVIHQLLHRGLMNRIVKKYLPIWANTSKYFQVGEFWYELGDRITWKPFTLLEKNHHRHRCHRLGHRVIAKDCVLGHSTAGAQV